MHGNETAAKAGRNGTDDAHGSVHGPCQDRSEMLCRVLREAPVLDRLSDEDKASLAGTCWDALETVLRYTRAVLQVHLDDPVLAGVAARVKGAPCAGEVALCGVRVPATDAGALLTATRDLGRDLPTMTKIVNLHEAASSEEETRASMELVRALAENPGGARVTGLTLPIPFMRPTTPAEAQAVAEVLRTPAVRDNLRSLVAAKCQPEPLDVAESWPEPLDVAEVLRGALRGLSALQHLTLSDTPPSWARLIDQYSSLTTLTLSHARPAMFGAREWETFLDALDHAAHLRSLELAVSGDGSAALAELRPRTPPAGLEKLCVGSRDPLRWWEATDLHTLELDREALLTREIRPYAVTPRDPAMWGRLVQLLGRNEKLRRLVIGRGDVTSPHEDVSQFFSALGRSTVEELVLEQCDRASSFDDGYISGAVSAGFAPVVHNDAGLRELDLRGCTGLACGLAALSALRINTTLRELRLDGSYAPEHLRDALSDMLKQTASLVELDLALPWTTRFCLSDQWRCGVRRGAVGLKLLGGLRENRTLQILRIRGDGLTNEGFCGLIEALYGGDSHEVRQLHTLEVSSREVSTIGVCSIAAVLKDNQRSSKLRKLALKRMCARDKGVEAIAEALRQNCGLVSMRLWDLSGVTARGWQALAGSLADNTTLRHLSTMDSVNALPASIPLRKQLKHAQRYAIAQRQASDG